MYSSREIEFCQWPVNIARPVIPRNMPTTSVAKTQFDTRVLVRGVRRSSVCFTGHTSTHARQFIHSSLQTLPALCTLIFAGHTFVQSSQSIHVDLLRVTLSGLNQLRAPSRAP